MSLNTTINTVLVFLVRVCVCVYVCVCVCVQAHRVCMCISVCEWILIYILLLCHCLGWAACMGKRKGHAPCSPSATQPLPPTDPASLISRGERPGCQVTGSGGKCSGV
ncbi:mCG1041308 [Mus musculus]|nr:mCG1041308 [Mus musculus]